MASGAARDPRRVSPWSVAEPTPLVGRVHELDLIVHSLAAGDTRLLTLVGRRRGQDAPGVCRGRSPRRRHPGDSSRFPDGVTLVDLTPVRDPDLVPGAIARALGLLDVGGRAALERVTEVLAERRQVVVLDNVEQVLPAAALLVADLLTASPQLALLVTQPGAAAIALGADVARCPAASPRLLSAAADAGRAAGHSIRGSLRRPGAGATGRLRPQGAAGAAVGRARHAATMGCRWRWSWQQRGSMCCRCRRWCAC